MKYIITEEKINRIDQSEVNMGPLGAAIRKAFELYDLPQVSYYLVLYTEKTNDYFLLVFCHGYYSSETKERVELFIKRLVPVEFLLIIFNTID